MKSAEQKAKKVPAIRFTGFDDAWVEKKLSELATMHARIGWQNLRTSEFLDAGDYMLVTGTDFEDGKISFSTCHYVAKERYDQDKNIQIRNGSILITKDGTLGKVAFVQNLTKPATLNAGVFNVELKNKKETDEKYVFQYLKAPFLMDYVGNKATGGTIKHLNQNILVDFPVVSPKKEEQQKIGSFFSNIDSLISLEQKKYDKLTQVKKSMLEKMFPKEGATVPEIRFAGFTGDWEEKKLGDTVLLRGRIGFRGYKETDLVPKGMGAITFSPADIDETGFISLENNKYLSWQKYDESPEIQVKVGDILFTKTASIGKVGYVQLLSNKATINPQFALLSPNENMNGYFIFLSVRNDSFMKKVKGITGGSSVPTMSQEKLKELTFLKTSIDEQNKIGSYFSHLDSLISLQQRKLEKLKNIKKSLLEKMFV